MFEPLARGASAARVEFDLLLLYDALEAISRAAARRCTCEEMVAERSEGRRIVATRMG